jgi:signal transduction histidine kinase
VTLGATVVLIGAFTLAALASAGLVRRSLTNDVDTTLTDRIDQVVGLMASGALPAVLEPTGREVGQVQVIDASGNVIAATPGLAQSNRFDVFEAPSLGKQDIDTVASEQLDGDTGEQFRVVARTVQVGENLATIWAISSLDAATSAQRYLRNGLLVGLPMLAVLTLLLISRIVTSALAPVAAMRADVDRIETTDLSARVMSPESDDEIAGLATTLNRLLDRVDQSAARQRTFAAAASHELRSPLSAIRTEVEVALTYPDRTDWPAVGRDVLIEVDRLETLSRDLRVLTRVRDQVRARKVVDLAAIVAGELGRRPVLAGIALTSTLAPGNVAADVDSVLQVLRNLLDNAERHAVSSVAVTVDTAAHRMRLRVANNGPPIAVTEHERIFEPFMRLDEARASDAGGSGLGLAIARATMRELGGTLTVDESEIAGAAFVAAFAAALGDTAS